MYLCGFAAVPVGRRIERKARPRREDQNGEAPFGGKEPIFKIDIVFRNALFQNRTVVPESFPVGVTLPAAAGEQNIHLLESILAYSTYSRDRDPRSLFLLF